MLSAPPIFEYVLRIPLQIQRTVALLDLPAERGKAAFLGASGPWEYQAESFVGIVLSSLAFSHPHVSWAQGHLPWCVTARF